MSIKEWMKEFYPTKPRENIESELQAARHSLKKWTGMREEVLEAYGITYKDKRFHSGLKEDAGLYKDYYPIGINTCALCEFHKLKAHYEFPDCSDCILNKICIECGEKYSAYSYFIKSCNPEPMIEVLERAVKILEEEQSE